MRRGLAAGLVATALTVAACSGGNHDTRPPGPASSEPVTGVDQERLALGDLEVLVEQRDDGRYRACVVEPGTEPPDAERCVGPHDGAAGPGRSWSQADRVGATVQFLVILGAGDSIADRRFTTVVSSRFPVAIAGGVVPDDGSGRVCTTYVSDGVHYRYDTGVTVTATDGVSVGNESVVAGIPPCAGP